MDSNKHNAHKRSLWVVPEYFYKNIKYNGLSLNDFLYAVELRTDESKEMIKRVSTFDFEKLILDNKKFQACLKPDDYATTAKINLGMYTEENLQEQHDFRFEQLSNVDVIIIDTVDRFLNKNYLVEKISHIFDELQKRNGKSDLDLAKILVTLTSNMFLYKNINNSKKEN